MQSYVVVLFCFLVSFILHMLIHRYYRAHLAGAIAVYAFGAVVLYGFGRMGYVSLPWSSGFLFVLLSCVAILFYIAIPLGHESSTTMILTSFQRKKRQTFGDLTTLLTDNELIFERIDDLVKTKLIQRRSGTLILTRRGNVVWRAMEAYRRVFHRILTE